MTIRVLVLGATGFLGRRLVGALAASDWAQPLAASRGAGRAGLLGALALDATDAAALGTALQQVDAVINAVAGQPATIAASAQALRSALDRRGQPALPLVHFSSMAVYGSAAGTIDESCPFGSDTSPYGQAKVAAEQRLGDYAGCVTLRPGCIYGGGSPQWSTRIAQLLRAHRIGDLGAAGDGCSNLVHVDDVVQATLAALRLPAAAGQAYNLAMAQAPSWNEYFIAYARALRATPVQRIGARRLALETRLLAPALKIAEIAGRRIGLRTPPPVPPSLARLWQDSPRLDSTRAQRTFALRWTPLQAALDREAST
ncbi:capsular biosynthesis protein [Cupriavidus sp. USMAHM13]|uniref:NAD-dependent epimerase/dehydratase family protein n=1 Tax=Cupriavidus sp. USMAHM13 TaxID=1389192 RepID=UPI0008A6FEBC|nr:NAD-dependent epimerase/dehydratase family protein [Cupriavidus sp. USMAHM13]AOY98943.1 capsular biosynthesis protein [Cupriavidus sp. USMAHM13]